MKPKRDRIQKAIDACINPRGVLSFWWGTRKWSKKKKRKFVRFLEELMQHKRS